MAQKEAAKAISKNVGSETQILDKICPSQPKEEKPADDKKKVEQQAIKSPSASLSQADIPPEDVVEPKLEKKQFVEWTAWSRNSSSILFHILYRFSPFKPFFHFNFSISLLVAFT